MDEYNNIKADEVIGDLIIEVKRGIHSARDLRAALLQLSYQLVIRPDKRDFLSWSIRVLRKSGWMRRRIK
jgi:hypothetical protein